MMLFVQNLTAQKITKKSFNSEANRIIVEFDYIDQVEIITTDITNQITVISKSEEVASSKINIEEVNDKLFIKSIDQNITGSDIAVIKLSNIRPKYSSYQILIPYNMNVDVSIVNGDFNANNFHGKLHLKMEEGTIKMDAFIGEVLIKINIGNVLITDIEDCSFDVRSNLGKVNSNIDLKNNNKNHFYGMVGNKKNSLIINALLANIHLKSTLN
ncbi:MAG: hypothetical protein J7K34_10360 [Flavobacteriaceae bacterium]|nr:hypothetical protein [Flavobacteriaceae bacterium]